MYTAECLLVKEVCIIDKNGLIQNWFFGHFCVTCGQTIKYVGRFTSWAPFLDLEGRGHEFLPLSMQNYVHLNKMKGKWGWGWKVKFLNLLSKTQSRMPIFQGSVSAFFIFINISQVEYAISYSLRGIFVNMILDALSPNR